MYNQTYWALVADVLRSKSHFRVAIRQLAEEFAMRFSANPRFNKDKFFKSCGVDK